MPAAASATELSQGQLVRVRQRNFVVTDVQASSLPPPMGSLPQRLVTLSSVDDEGLGEELQVIWELEAGAAVSAAAELPEPTGFDSPERLDAFLNSLRWGAVASADSHTLQSPFRSGIQLEQYQLAPVARALKMPRANLLIADDVGLGKTIEAGLVVQELILRHRARSVLVVCPSSLQIQWQDQMRDKFGLEFRIVDSQLMRDLRRTLGLHVNPWSHFPRLITSMDFIKRDRPFRLFRDLLPPAGHSPFPRKFDLLIVDEAHNIAPSGTGSYAIESIRTAAIRTIAPHFEHRLFLTATPHNGYTESFTALLELIDNQRFLRGVSPDPKQLAAVMVRRLKTDILDAFGKPRFRQRQIQALEVPYTDEERQAHADLEQYSDLRRRRAQDPSEQNATDFVLVLLKKRLFSSPASFHSTLQRHLSTIGQPSRPRTRQSPQKGLLERRLRGIEEEFIDDDVYVETTDELIDAASDALRDLEPQERDLLDRLQSWSEKAAARSDSKADRLLSWLEEIVRPGGEWSDQRALIFTEYRATQNWLQMLLATRGLGGSRLMVLYGGMQSEDRERIKAAFQTHPSQSEVRILLATDAASEGIDLQNHCHNLVHYEIPWNPNRLEQRNGRLDRHGQTHDVLVHHFVGEGFSEKSNHPGTLEGDLEFLLRVVRKVEQMREDLGKVSPVIADQVQRAMTGRSRELDTTAAEPAARIARAVLKIETRFREEVQRLSEQVYESKESLQLTHQNVQAAVQIGLELAGQPALIPVSIPGADAARSGPSAFHLPKFSGAWRDCERGLQHPHTKQRRPIVFDENLSKGRDDVVHAHLNHRLVELSLRLLRAESWAPTGKKRLHRVAARVISDDLVDTPVVCGLARLLILAQDGRRLHEEIVSAGGRIVEGKFRELKADPLKKLMAAPALGTAPETLLESLSSVWPQCRTPLLNALRKLGEERTAVLERDLRRRSAEDASNLTALLKELEQSIRKELANEQVGIFSEVETTQRLKDRDAQAARLREIPGEMEREVNAIQLRYENAEHRILPVAVLFLVPSRFCRS